MAEGCPVMLLSRTRTSKRDCALQTARVAFDGRKGELTMLPAA